MHIYCNFLAWISIPILKNLNFNFLVIYIINKFITIKKLSYSDLTNNFNMILSLCFLHCLVMSCKKQGESFKILIKCLGKIIYWFALR